MKQYRIRVEGRIPQWSDWMKLDVPLKDHNILTIQFDQALTVDESKEFFKHFMEQV